MLFKPKNLKFYLRVIFPLILLKFQVQKIVGQETVKFKLDGVASVVGDYVILDSDIDKTFSEMESQGISTKNVTRCELLGKLMEDKLLTMQSKTA